MQFWLDNLPFLGQAKGFGRFTCPVPLHYYDLPTNASSIDPLTEGIGGSFLPLGLYEFQLTSILSSDEKGTYLYWQDPSENLFEFPIDTYLIVKYNRNTDTFESLLEVAKDDFRVNPYQIYLDGEPNEYYSSGQYYFSIFLLIAYDTRGCPVCFSNVAISTKKLITNKNPNPITPISPPIAPPPICIEVSSAELLVPGGLNGLNTSVPGARFAVSCTPTSPWPPNTPIGPNFPIIPPPPPPPVGCDKSTWNSLLSLYSLSLRNPNGFGRAAIVSSSTIQTNIPLVGSEIFHYGSLQKSSDGVKWFTSQNFRGGIPTRFSPISLPYGSTYFFRFKVQSNVDPNCIEYFNIGSITTSPLVTNPAPIPPPGPSVPPGSPAFPAPLAPRSFPQLQPFTLTTVDYPSPSPGSNVRGQFSFTSAGPTAIRYALEVSQINDSRFFSSKAYAAPPRILNPAACDSDPFCLVWAGFRSNFTYYVRARAESIYRNVAPIYSNTITVSSSNPNFFRGGGGFAAQDTHWFFLNKHHDGKSPLDRVRGKVPFWIDDNVSANKINLFYLKESGVSGVEYKVQYTQKEGIVDTPNELIAPDGTGPCIGESGFYINDVFVYSGDSRLIPSEEEPVINIKNLFEIYYAKHTSSALTIDDYFTRVDFLNNSSGLSGVETMGGWFYHFAKKVGSESTGAYHAVGNGVDGIGLFLGTPRSVFETGYLEESPVSGFIEAFNEKMGHGTGSGILGEPFGTITNHGTQNDLCWDPLISQSSMVEISYDLSNVKNFRGIIDGSIYNIASGGAITEIGKIEYVNTGFDSSTFQNPSSIINKYYINITGYLAGTDGIGCSICDNSRLSGSGAGNSLNFEVLHDVSGFNFAAESTGILRFSGLYKKYEPQISCLSSIDLGEVESMTYVENVPYSTVNRGNAFFCAPTGGCTTKELGSSITHGISFTGKFYQPSGNFWIGRVANTGSVPVTISAYRITVSGSGSTIVNYTGMGLNEDGISQTISTPGGCAPEYGTCAILCTGQTGFWSGSSTPFSREIGDNTTDFLIMLCRPVQTGSILGSDSIQEDLQYIRSSDNHPLTQNIVDYFNKFVDYRSGINIPRPISCPTERLQEFHKSYSLDDFEEIEYFTTQECSKFYIDFSIGQEKITYDPVNIKVKNESNLPILFSVGAGRFKTNYGVVDPSGTGIGKPHGNIEELNFDDMTVPDFCCNCADPTFIYPSGRLGYTAPNKETQEFLIDPAYDYILLHVHRVAFNEGSATLVSRPTQSHSQIDELYLISKSGVSEEIKNYFSNYSSGYLAAVPDPGDYLIRNYGAMSKHYNLQSANGGLAGLTKTRLFEISGDWEKNKNILLTYNQTDSLITTLNGTFSGFDPWPATSTPGTGLSQMRRETNLSIPSTSGYHFKFVVNSGVVYNTSTNVFGTSTGVSFAFMPGTDAVDVSPDLLYRGFYLSDNSPNDNLVSLYGVLSSGAVGFTDMSEAASFAEYTTATLRNLSVTEFNSLSDRADEIYSLINIPYSGIGYIAGRERCPGALAFGVYPVEKDKIFEIVLKTGDQLNCYISGANRIINANYDGVGDLNNYTFSYLHDPVSINMYRVNHQVTIENYGPEQFGC